MTEYIVEADCEYSDELHQVIERIVRCKDCRHLLKKGYVFDESFNAAEDTACSLFSNVDFDYDYESFWYVKPDDFCKWGERK